MLDGAKKTEGCSCRRDLIGLGSLAFLKSSRCMRAIISQDAAMRSIVDDKTRAVIRI